MAKNTGNEAVVSDNNYGCREISCKVRIKNCFQPSVKAFGFIHKTPPD
jgi:hypothetical protein